ncbi:hypothetical protein BOX15_Mlig010657g1, partial [Macrostomum lignano]
LRTLAMELIINRLSSHACCAAACYTTEDTPASVHGFAVHLHKFPSDDQVAVRWIEILELRDVDLNFVRQRRLKVCSLHFKETDYSCPLHERRSARLRKDALPNPYTFPPRLEKESVEVEPRPDHIADNMYPPVLHREDTYAVELVTDESPARIFTHKNFEDSRYGLTQPSSACVAIFCKMEKIFRREMATAAAADAIWARILGRFERVGVQLPFCIEHRAESNAQAARLFVHMRLHQWCREKMETVRKERDRAIANRKLKKL